MLILSWQDNVPRKDMPPEWMWCLPDELVDHFEEVRAAREEGRERDDDDAPGMLRNEYARGRGRRR